MLSILTGRGGMGTIPTPLIWPIMSTTLSLSTRSMSPTSFIRICEMRVRICVKLCMFSSSIRPIERRLADWLALMPDLLSSRFVPPCSSKWNS